MHDLDRGPVRLADFIVTLSLATDLGMGQPLEHAASTCLLAVRAGESLGLPVQDLSDTYYLALLRFAGCTADAHEAAASVGGDEIVLRAGLATVLMADMPEFVGYMMRGFAAGQAPLSRLRLVLTGLAEGKTTARRSIAEHCEVAQMLATRMGLPRRIGELTAHVFERWDGKGLPGERAAEAIPAPARIAAVARDVDVFFRLGGWPLASEVLRKRRAGAYDPDVTAVLLDNGEAWLAEAAQSPTFDAVVASEPGLPLQVEPSQIDEVLRAFADFADLKVHYTRGHSTRTGELAAEAARLGGMTEADAVTLRRAGYVHDLGKAGIPNGILEKTGTLSPDEWERVRLHPYLTERILNRCPALQPIALLAASHHERLDGSGYHKALSGANLAPGAGILAVANAYDAMLQSRPYRPPFGRETVERMLREQASAGKFSTQAVECVLAAAGHAVQRHRRELPAGLTEREVEVLRLISRGHTNKDVGRALTLSPKTAGRHIENIYAKIGVSSRAAAAMFAMHHGLIEP